MWRFQSIGTMAALVDYSRFDSIADDDAPAAAPAAATAPPEPQKSKMSWTNDERAAVLTMPLPPGTRGGDVHVRFTSSRVFILVKDMGEIALDHPAVDATACKWAMEAAGDGHGDDESRAPVAIITLAKASRELWPRGTFDAAGSSTPPPATAAGGEHEGASSFTWAQEDTTVSVSMGVPATTRASDGACARGARNSRSRSRCRRPRVGALRAAHVAADRGGRDRLGARAGGRGSDTQRSASTAIVAASRAGSAVRRGLSAHSRAGAGRARTVL